MRKFLLSLVFAAPLVYADGTASLARSYEHLCDALNQQTEALEDIETSADAAEAALSVMDAQRVLKELMSVDEKALWDYIENTEDKKKDIIDIMVRLALQYDRLKKNNYFDNADLKELLSAQIEFNPEAAAKREKLEEVDHDADD